MKATLKRRSSAAWAKNGSKQCGKAWAAFTCEEDGHGATFRPPYLPHNTSSEFVGRNSEVQMRVLQCAH